MADEKDKQDLKMTALQYLKNKIIFCELLPGSIIDEAAIAFELKTSRTPVREALLELQREEYVSIIPRKSTRVTRVSVQNMKRVYEARILVEVPLIKALGPFEQPELLESLKQMQEHWKSMLGLVTTNENYRDFVKADMEFHLFLISLCDNPHLVRFCSEMICKSQRFWYLIISKMGARMELVAKEHIEILDCLLSGNMKAAATFTKNHILNSQRATGILDE